MNKKLKQLQAAINYGTATSNAEYHSDYWQAIPSGGKYFTPPKPFPSPY